MGLRDEELRERQVIKGDESFIQPNQITSTEIQDGSTGMGTADIKDAAITKLKIKATALDTTKGLRRHAAADAQQYCIEVNPDGTYLELDGGVSPAKKLQIADDGVTADKLAATVAGYGLTGGAGSALALDPDVSTLSNTAAGNALEVPDDGVASAALFNASALGDGVKAVGTKLELDIVSALGFTGGGAVQISDAGCAHDKFAEASKIRRVPVAINPIGLVAPVTVDVGILAVPDGKSIKVLNATIACTVCVNDNDSPVVGTLYFWDMSGSVAVNMMTGGTAHDLEVAGTPAKLGVDLSLDATKTTLEEKDFLYFEVVADDTGGDNTINTDIAGGVLTIEYIEV